jgi:hypothetical protein
MSKMKEKLTDKSLVKVCAFVALTQLAACANLGVQPWERDLLAKEEMALDSAGIDLGLDDHIYFSKEATSGGRAFAGGGCGCN